MRAPSVCSVVGCPADATRRGRCTRHAREQDAARGTRQQRGYDAEHDRLRALWAPRVATGTVHCWRCDRLIAPGSDWHLGHNDTRTRHEGPEHAHCNLSAAGTAAHQ
jgi:hypothetical protein